MFGLTESSNFGFSEHDIYGFCKMQKNGTLDFSIPPVKKKYFNIFGALLHSTVGDFVDHVLYCASVKELISNSRLDVYFKPDRIYKKDIISMAQGVDRSWPTMDPLPVNLFDTSSNRSPIGPDDWYLLGCACPDLLILPSNGTFHHLTSLPRTAQFRIPNRERHEADLRSKVGEGWYVVLHYREPNFEFRRSESLRDANLELIPAIIERVIQLGGQVVRIGHPQMSVLEDRPGFIDLKDADFLLQAHAIARARCFFEASPSGPASLAIALKVPVARCNQADLRCVSKDQGIIVPQRVIHKSGEDLTRYLIETAQIDVKGIQNHPDLTYQHVEISKLFEALDCILDMTQDCDTGWRSDTLLPPPPPTNDFFPSSPKPFIASVLV